MTTRQLLKIPRNQEVLVDPEGLPGVYLAHIVATLEYSKSSLNVSGSPPFMVNTEKSLLVKSVFSTGDQVDKPVVCGDGSKFVASCNGCSPVTENDGGFLKVGSDECLPKSPEGGLPVAATSHRDDLQAESSSLPVENRIGTLVDTHQICTAQVDEKGIKGQKTNKETETNTTKERRTQKGVQLLGYVPMQIVNLSLEEVELGKQRYIGVASPIQVDDTQNYEKYVVNSVVRTHGETDNDFKRYLKDKLAHLDGKDRYILEPLLQQYKHLFYGLGSTKLGCISQVEHSIDTGDARPIKRNPYRTPHALKPVVVEHINDMLERDIIEPRMSPWSSSIVLVQKKSKDGSIKYRFCVDYRTLNAVTKPDVYPIPNIVDTLDLLGQQDIYSVRYGVGLSPDTYKTRTQRIDSIFMPSGTFSICQDALQTEQCSC